MWHQTSNKILNFNIIRNLYIFSVRLNFWIFEHGGQMESAHIQQIILPVIEIWQSQIEHVSWVLFYKLHGHFFNHVNRYGGSHAWDLTWLHLELLDILLLLGVSEFLDPGFKFYLFAKLEKFIEGHITFVVKWKSLFIPLWLIKFDYEFFIFDVLFKKLSGISLNILNHLKLPSQFVDLRHRFLLMLWQFQENLVIFHSFQI